MSAQRPTPAQLRGLEAIEKGLVKWAPAVHGISSSYFMLPPGVRADTIQRCLNRGWATRPPLRVGDFRSLLVDLTDAGRVVLDAERARA